MAIPKSWILLDCQSTVDVFSNNKLITNIRESKCVLTLHCNAGKVSVTQKGYLRGYGTVWYCPDGIANILLLYNVQKKHRITFDSDVGTGFTVHKEDGSTRVFKPSKKGLFYSDVKSGVVLINTVDSIKNKYTVKEYSDACKARSIQDMIGQPSTKDFIKYVEGNMLPNCHKQIGHNTCRRNTRTQFGVTKRQNYKKNAIKSTHNGVKLPTRGTIRTTQKHHT